MKQREAQFSIADSVTSQNGTEAASVFVVWYKKPENIKAFEEYKEGEEGEEGEKRKTQCA